MLVTRYHEDGRAKPIVAIASVIDTTSCDLPWSLSEELTMAITQNVQRHPDLFVEPSYDLTLADNPFSLDLSWMNKEFKAPHHEFVVFLELAKHEVQPVLKHDLPKEELSSSLDIAVRLRVVDVRKGEPEIILQELVEGDFFIPKNLFPTNYEVACWGTREYESTLLAQAHQQIVRSISSRIADYILLAKSR
jgi:hypothetical protein